DNGADARAVNEPEARELDIHFRPLVADDGIDHRPQLRRRHGIEGALDPQHCHVARIGSTERHALTRLVIDNTFGAPAVYETSSMKERMMKRPMPDSGRFSRSGSGTDEKS